MFLINQLKQGTKFCKITPSLNYLLYMSMFGTQPSQWPVWHLHEILLDKYIKTEAAPYCQTCAASVDDIINIFLCLAACFCWIISLWKNPKSGMTGSRVGTSPWLRHFRIWKCVWRILFLIIGERLRLSCQWWGCHEKSPVSQGHC